MVAQTELPVERVLSHILLMSILLQRVSGKKSPARMPTEMASGAKLNEITVIALMSLHLTSFACP